MLKLDVLRILEERGKSKYWLNKQIGMSGRNFNMMVYNETKSIRYDVLETMCIALDCTPNDLLVFVPDEAPDDNPPKEGQPREKKK